MIVGLHHVAIGVPDFEAGLAFYRDTLGFEQVERSSFSGPSRAVEAAIGIKEPTAHMAMLRTGAISEPVQGGDFSGKCKGVTFPVTTVSFAQFSISNSS